MLEVVRGRWKALSRKGFAGPRYRGLFGRLRFAMESLVARNELVFVLDPSDFDSTPRSGSEVFELVPIPDWAALEMYREDLEERWYPGLLESWQGPFDWGEKLFLGLRDGRVVSFNWLQIGSASGAPVHWGRLFTGEFRILRGGVAPAFRGQGLNTLMKHRLIGEVFAEGARRAYAECYEANIPSVRTLKGLGFRPFARLQVLELPGLRSFVRWKALPQGSDQA